MTETTRAIGATLKQSVARVEIFTGSDPDDWNVVFHFDDALYDEAGNRIGVAHASAKRVERRLGDIKKDVSVADVISLITEDSHKFRQEDIAEELAKAAEQENIARAARKKQARRIEQQ